MLLRLITRGTDHMTHSYQTLVFFSVLKAWYLLILPNSRLCISFVTFLKNPLIRFYPLWYHADHTILADSKWTPSIVIIMSVSKILQLTNQYQCPVSFVHLNFFMLASVHYLAVCLIVQDEMIPRILHQCCLKSCSCCWNCYHWNK